MKFRAVFLSFFLMLLLGCSASESDQPAPAAGWSFPAAPEDPSPSKSLQDESLREEIDALKVENPPQDQVIVLEEEIEALKIEAMFLIDTLKTRNVRLEAQIAELQEEIKQGNQIEKACESTR